MLKLAFLVVRASYYNMLLRNRAFLIGGIALGLFLFIYFVVREWQSPVIFGSPESSEEQEAPQPDDVRVVEEVDLDLPEYADELSTDRINESLEEEAFQLVRLLESQLQGSIQQLEAGADQQQQVYESAIEEVRGLVGDYQQITKNSVAEIGESLQLVGQLESELDRANEEVKSAKAGWEGLFSSLTEISTVSLQRLDERNFRFEEYAVGHEETLPVIAQKLKDRYDIPEADMVRLLQEFNSIEYRLVNPGGRRQPFRAVSNETLRVPLPLSSGEMLSNYEVPDQLQEQLDHIRQVSAHHLAIREDLRNQIGQLQSVQGRLQGLNALNQDLRDITSRDFPDMESFLEETELTPEQRDAWSAFRESSAALQRANDQESRKMARTQLREAMQQLLESYGQPISTEQSSKDPLQAFMFFIEDYAPEAAPED